MTITDIVILLIIIAYIAYRTVTPKKGDELSTPVGRFFKALLKSILVLFIIGFIFGIIRILYIGSVFGGFLGFFSLFGR